MLLTSRTLVLEGLNVSIWRFVLERHKLGGCGACSTMQESSDGEGGVLLAGRGKEVCGFL